MSINLTVALPRETVVAIQNARAAATNGQGEIKIPSSATRAVIEAVHKLPYQLAPNSDQRSHSPGAFNTDYAPTVSGAEPKEQRTIFVRTMTGRITTIHIDSSATVAELAPRVHDGEGIPTDQQFLVYGGRKLYVGPEVGNDERARSAAQRTIEEVSARLRSSFF